MSSYSEGNLYRNELNIVRQTSDDDAVSQRSFDYLDLIEDNKKKIELESEDNADEITRRVDYINAFHSPIEQPDNSTNTSGTMIVDDTVKPFFDKSLIWIPDSIMNPIKASELLTHQNPDSDHGTFNSHNSPHVHETGEELKDNAVTQIETTRTLLSDQSDISPPQRKSIAQQHRVSIEDGSMEEYEDENLGEDFLESPWVPPSIELAEEFRYKNLFRPLDMKLSAINVTKARDCGPGLPLHFQFVKSMGICFFIMSLFSIPALFFSFIGSKIPFEDQDAIGLFQFTIGNIGFNPKSPDLATVSACVLDGSYGSNDSLECIHFWGIQLNLVQVAYIVTLCEIIQILIFFITLLYLNRTRDLISHLSDGRDCRVSDYSIMVTNLPPNTTLQMIVSHFSRLYQLNETDTSKRPPVYQAEIVINNHNTHNHLFLNTWVAEATVFKKFGKVIRAFNNQKQITMNLFRSRAFMKMYQVGTVHADGPDAEKFKVWEGKVASYDNQIDRLTESLFHKQTLHKTRTLLKRQRTISINDNSSTTTQQHTISDVIGADAVAAFVVFNHSESMARCVSDYTKYSRFPWSICYPDRLLFLGKRLIVTRAPEPDEVIWENLEVSSTLKAFYRIRNIIFTVVFLIIGFIVVLESALYHASFQSQLPLLNLCTTEIPALYYGSYALPSSDISMARPSSATISTVDKMCTSTIPGSFYAINTINGDINKPIGKYNYSICNKYKIDNSLATCPHWNQTLFCPCVSFQVSTSCSTLTCANHDIKGICQIFQTSNIAACYCYDGLKSAFGSLSNGVEGFLQWLNGPCYSFFVKYSQAQALMYLAALVTVATNAFLKLFIVWSTRSECYNSFDVENGNVIRKIFVAIYLNMAVVVLLAFGYLRNNFSVLQTLGILNGVYTDLTPSWYGQVGFYLVITYILNAFSPYLGKVFKVLIFPPLFRWLELSKVRENRSHKISMQHDLNNMFIGPENSSTMHCAHLLTLLFFGMTYGPGIPIFMPLLCVTFTVYFYFDKFLLCRFYRRPRYSNDGANEIVLAVLPFAAIIRMCVACWMLSNNEIFPSVVTPIDVLPQSYTTDPTTSQIVYTNYINNHEGDTSIQYIIASKLSRQNIVPILVLLTLTLLYLFIKRILWKYLPVRYVLKFISRLGTYICSMGEIQVQNIRRKDGFVHTEDLFEMKDPLRRESAPFTGTYFKYLKPINEEVSIFGRILKWFNLYLDRGELSDEEREKGWRLDSKDDEYIIKKKFKDGEALNTYDVIEEWGCSSYAIERIPAYATAIKGLMEGLGFVV